MDRGFVEEASGDGIVAGPYRLQQLAAIHFDVRGMRRSLDKQFLEALVDRREAAIVSHLEDFAAWTVAASRTRRASSSVVAMGFSQKTCLPAAMRFERERGVAAYWSVVM